MDKCPCHSQKPYESCCKPYHDGALPDTALQLMRSRYSAYALNLPDYIIKTTHPSSPHYEAILRPPNLCEFGAARKLSRFSCFSEGSIEYIQPSEKQLNPEALARSKFTQIGWSQYNLKRWKESIAHFSHSTKFLDLIIHEFIENREKATVTFTAVLAQDGADVSFTEKSRFEKVGDAWLYESRE